MELLSWHTDDRRVQLPKYCSLWTKCDRATLDLLAGWFLKRALVDTPSGFLSGYANLESRFDEFESLHVIPRTFKPELRACPRNVILGGQEETVDGNCGQIVADKRSEPHEV